MQINQEQESYKVEIMERLAKFCMAKGIKFTPEQVEIQATMMLAAFTYPAICNALTALFYETVFFPDSSLVAKKIKELSQVGDGKSLATKKAGEIIDAIHSTGFDSLKVKEKFGEKIYDLIGGGPAIRSYAVGDIPQGTFKAQIRDAIEAVVKPDEEKKALQEVGAITNEACEIFGYKKIYHNCGKITEGVKNGTSTKN